MGCKESLVPFPGVTREKAEREKAIFTGCLLCARDCLVFYGLEPIMQAVPAVPFAQELLDSWARCQPGCRGRAPGQSHCLPHTLITCLLKISDWISFFLFFFFGHTMQLAYGGLTSQIRDGTRALAVRALSPNHCSSSVVPACTGF